MAIIGHETDTIMGMPSGKQAPSGPLARAISAEIRAVMARQRVTATQLADRAGMSRNYLGKRLRDEVPFTVNDVESMCNAMREDICVLLRAAYKRIHVEHPASPDSPE